MTRPWRRWPGLRFGSLHARLLAAFVLIIVLALTSAGAGVVWIIQGYRSRLAIDHLSDLAVVASLSARQLERQDARPEEIGAFVDNQLVFAKMQDVRILVLDAQGRVLVERPTPAPGQEPLFVGYRLEMPTPVLVHPPGDRRAFVAPRATIWTRPAGARQRPFIVVSAGGPVPAPPPDLRSEDVERFLARQPAYRVVLAVPEHNLAAAWRELLPGLSVAAAIALAASVAAAFWLSRSISRPLRRMTRAVEGIARGDLRQQIPVQGGDEVAHLAQSFNIMSQEVARSQQALRDFLANASHELRTPLTSIQGFSQALLDGALRGEEGAGEAGRIINEEAERMRRLVEDLLYLSRVESRDVAATRGPVDVASLLREASRRLQVTAERRGLTVTLDVPDLSLLHGNADELDHLFGNLLDNAGKYAPPGGTITVSARATREAAVVSVHNTGSVILPEDLPHIFERFYRVEKSRAREVDGSGLGLAIAQEVAERHDGTIRVASTPGDGTTFVVTLPLNARPSERPPHPRPLSHEGRGESLSRWSIRQVRRRRRSAAASGG